MAVKNYQTNEDLLQSYRQIFISFESLLLAVGAIVYNKNLVVMLFITAIGISTIWVIWYRIVRSRHLIVDYYKFSMKDYLPADNNSEETYVHSPKLRREANQDYEATHPQKRIRNGLRPTRVKLDLILPILLTVIWCVLLVFTVYNCLVSPNCYLQFYALISYLQGF